MTGAAAPPLGQLILFYAFALFAVTGALATVTRKSAVVAVVCLVGTFFALAGEFLLLYAPFLAVIQVLVYAGAIMVLFVFVVMIVSRTESGPLFRATGLPIKAIAFSGLGLLFYRGARALTALPSSQAEPPGRTFGSVEEVGRVLLSDYAYPFEAISVLLLVAVVGALVIARQHHDKEREPTA